ncbi:diaminopimelate epimerase [Streptomyces sp. NPDC020875]|uniref:diaminopimelate epimerase n=1 Tax=Streptomyces sp. NPDC020875 TaxID=3154898 RepID=UPI00340ED569
MTDATIRFAKGHGAGNDFIVLPDPAARIRLTAEMVRSLCDRRTGIGADGILRAVHSTALSEAAAMAGEAEWFMDYRNADGSRGSMCGNGIRVFARYLADTGLCPVGTHAIATRAGVRHVHIPRHHQEESDITVAMGEPLFPGPDGITVTAAGREWPALHINVGNPHAVAFVDALGDAGDLQMAPTVTPGNAYPEGVTVEFVTIQGPQHLAVRVHERGVGETPACGTGACAAVAALRRHQHHTSPGKYMVAFPGGRLCIDVDANGLMGLTGPAAIVAEGTAAFTSTSPAPRPRITEQRAHTATS